MRGENGVPVTFGEWLRQSRNELKLTREALASRVGCSVSALLDRFDIHIEVPRVNYEKLTADRLGETSDKVRARVLAARDRQPDRFKATDLVYNADTPALSPQVQV